MTIIIEKDPPCGCTGKQWRIGTIEGTAQVVAICVGCNNVTNMSVSQKEELTLGLTTVLETLAI